MRIILDGHNPSERDPNDPVFYAQDDSSYMTISTTENKLFVDVEVTDTNGNVARVVLKVLDLKRATITL